jgi:hypothetical protein
MERWRQYCNEILNIKDNVVKKKCVKNLKRKLNAQQTMRCGKQRMLKNNKLPRKDSIRVELIKYRDKKL